MRQLKKIPLRCNAVDDNTNHPARARSQDGMRAQAVNCIEQRLTERPVLQRQTGDEAVSGQRDNAISASEVFVGYGHRSSLVRQQSCALGR